MLKRLMPLDNSSLQTCAADSLSVREINHVYTKLIEVIVLLIPVIADDENIKF